MLQSLYSLSGQIYWKMSDTPGIELPEIRNWNWLKFFTSDELLMLFWMSDLDSYYSPLWGQLGQGCSYWLGSCTESLAFVLHKHRHKTGGKRSGGCRSHRQMWTWLRIWGSWTPLARTLLQQMSENNDNLDVEIVSLPIRLTAATASEPSTSGTLSFV